MNKVKIVVTAPKGNGRSNIAAQVIAGIRNAGFQCGLTDKTPDFDQFAGQKYVSNTIVQVVCEEEITLADVKPEDVSVVGPTPETKLLNELVHLLGTEVDGSKDTGALSVLQRILKERADLRSAVAGLAKENLPKS